MSFICQQVSPLAQPPVPLPNYISSSADFSDVTALVKTFLRDEYLFRCVESLRQSYRNIQIAVADDGHFSSDRVKRLQDLGCQVHLLSFNSGLSYGRNWLVDHCTTPYCLIGDDDFRYSPGCRLDWLRELLQTTGADVAAGACHQDRMIAHYEGDFVYQDDGGLVYKASPTRWSNHHGQPPYRRVDIALNFFMAKTEAVRHVKWDPTIGAYEHEDWFLQAAEVGLKTVYCPDVVVEHRYLDKEDPKEYQELRYSRKGGPEFRAKWASRFRYTQDLCSRRQEMRA